MIASKVLKAVFVGLSTAQILLKAKVARAKGRRLIFIMGTPIHQNLGDQAIARAEVEFLKGRIDAQVIKVPLPLITSRNMNKIFNLVSLEDIVMGHGGGNMGDVYLEEEFCRRSIVEHFPDNRLVIFPQTIHFTSSKIGNSELKRTQALYATHTKLTLIAREETSFRAMKQYFPSNDIILTPDIVLSMQPPVNQQHRKGALVCVRDDKEGKLTQKNKQSIESILEKRFKEVHYTNTISKSMFFFFQSKQAVLRQKFKEFASSEFVVTDRLHGMVFSAITGTPCVALANFNHKVQGTYKWIEHLPYIKFCDDIAKLDEVIAGTDSKRQFEYDPTKFDQYWNLIMERLR